MLYPPTPDFVRTITRPIHKISRQCNLYYHLCTYTQSVGTILEPQVNILSWPNICKGLPYEFFLGWGLLAAMHIYASNAEHSAWQYVFSGVGLVVHLDPTAMVCGKPHLTAVKQMVINTLQHLSVTCTCEVTGLKKPTAWGILHEFTTLGHIVSPEKETHKPWVRKLSSDHIQVVFAWSHYCSLIPASVEFCANNYSPNSWDIAAV
jgi:hypothetical protein